MATVTITGNTIRGATASKDNRTWQVRAIAYQYGGIGGGVITPGADWETLYPIDGVLTFTAESGAVVDIKTPEEVPYRVRIPTSDAGLWDVIEAGVAYQPDVAQDNLNLAVANAAPGFIAAELGLQTADSINADLTSREITFTDEGGGEGYFSIGDVQVSGTLVPPAATWSGVAGIPDWIAEGVGIVPVTDADDIATAISAIQSAGQGILYVPFGVTLTPTTETVLPDEVVGLVVDGEVVISDDVTGFSRTGEALGSGSDFPTANVDAGDRNISVTSSSGYAVDDWVFISSEDVLTGSTDKVGYMRQVSYIPDATTLRLDVGCPRSMSTANNVRVRRIQLAAPFSVSGHGTIRYDDPESYFSPMFDFTLMPQPHFAPTLKLRDGGGSCIRLNHVVGGAGALTANIDNFLDDNQYSGHYGYGVLLSGGCRDNVIEGRISRCRHACTTGTGPNFAAFPFRGEPENFTFAPVTYKCTDKCLDSHRAGYGGRYILQDTGSGGAQVRCDGIHIEGSLHQLNTLVAGNAIRCGTTAPSDGTIDHAPTIGHVTVTGSQNASTHFLVAYSDVEFDVLPTLRDFAGDLVSSSSTGNVSYPPNSVRRIDMLPFATPDVVTGTWTVTGDTASIHAGYLASSAQNDALSWDVHLDAGTWEVDILTRTGSDKGIADVQIDGSTVEAVDLYSGSGTRNVQLTASGAGGVLTWSGTRTLKILMDTKNVSSSAYRAQIQQVSLRRTA